MPKISHSDETKAKALQFIKDHKDLSMRECAKRLNIKINTLYGWIKKQQKEMPSPKKAFAEQGDTISFILPKKPFVEQVVTFDSPKKFEEQLREKQKAQALESLKYQYKSLIEFINMYDKLFTFRNISHMTSLSGHDIKDILLNELGEIAFRIANRESPNE